MTRLAGGLGFEPRLTESESGRNRFYSMTSALRVVQVLLAARTEAFVFGSISAQLLGGNPNPRHLSQ